jgi:ribulose-phosphate 3-epimerase
MRDRADDDTGLSMSLAGLPGNRLLADVSLWSANLANLEGEVRRLDRYADLYHFDVSDAHFTPNLLFFPDLVAAVRPLTARMLHVHLMVENPLDHIDKFVEAGADVVSIHLENGALVHGSLQRIKELKKEAGLVLDFETDPASVAPFLDSIDLIVLMGTPLGVKGQGASPRACVRLEAARSMLAEKGFAGRIKIAADGGIRKESVPLLRRAGADMIVPGSLVFQSSDLAATFGWIRSL